MAEAAAKMCKKCGIDVAGKPRVKDQNGRYLCQPCFDRLKVEKAQKSPASEAPTSGGEASSDEGIFGVVDLDTLKPVEEAQKPRELKVCPACGKAHEKDSVVCINCGFDERAGFQRGTGVGASARKGGKTACPSCGYDLKGLKKPRCPECGKVLAMVTEKAERDAASKAIAKKAYFRPILMFVIGVAGLLLIGALTGQSGVNMAGRLALSYVIGVPIGLAVYVICCLIWIGFDAPIHRVALSLVGISAIVDLVGVVVGLIPIPLLALAATAVTYVGLLMEELDLDLVDAVIVAVLTIVAKVFLVVLVAAVVMGLFN